MAPVSSSFVSKQLGLEQFTRDCTTVYRHKFEAHDWIRYAKCATSSFGALSPRISTLASLEAAWLMSARTSLIARLLPMIISDVVLNDSLKHLCSRGLSIKDYANSSRLVCDHPSSEAWQLIGSTSDISEQFPGPTAVAAGAVCQTTERFLLQLKEQNMARSHPQTVARYCQPLALSTRRYRSQPLSPKFCC